jgi:hypothetical protein
VASSPTLDQVPSGGALVLGPSYRVYHPLSQVKDLGNIVRYTRVLNGRFGRPRPWVSKFQRNGASLVASITSSSLLHCA